MAALLDTKRAALHDISNKGGSLPGVEKVREPRADGAGGHQFSPCACARHTQSPASACQQVSQRIS